MSFAGHGVLPLLSLNSVINFVVDFTLPFGLLMELPLVVDVLAHLGWVHASWLVRQRRIAMFVAFLLGAVFAPPTDMISMTGIAVGTYLLYESSIVVAH